MTTEGSVSPTTSLVPAEIKDRLPGLGPRRWVFDLVETWLRGPDRFFVLSGGPGTGKTMLASQILAGAGVPEGRDVWAAAHFCSNRLTGYSRHPRQLISNLQRRLSERHPEAFLPRQPEAVRPLIELAGSVTAESVAGTATGVNLTIGQLTAAPLSIGDFFQVAVVEPLTWLAAAAPRTTVGIVIDGLDEAAMFDGPNIVSLLHDYSASLPSTCKVLVTSQNAPAVLDPLFAAVTDLVRLDLSSPTHRAAVDDDVRRFVRTRTVARAGQDDLPERIARTAGGNFLQADGLVREAIGGGAPSAAPQDLSTYYHDIFDRMRHTAESTGPGDWAARCLPFLHHLAVSRAPRTFDSVMTFFDWSISTLLRSLQATRAVLVLDDDLRTVHLEHQAVASFLLSEVSAGSRPNPYGTAEGTLQAALVERVADLLPTRWGGDWGSADKYFVEFAAAHLQRLQFLDPTAGRARGDRLQLVDLAVAIASAPARLSDAQAAMTTLLRVASAWADDEPYDSMVLEAAASSDPFTRSAVLDSLQLDVAGRRAFMLVMRLLGGKDIGHRIVGISAMSRLDDEYRGRTVRWIATEAPPDLRRYAGYALYLLAGQDARLAASTLLDPVVDAVSLAHPRRTQRAIEFLSTVSITAYTNNCDDPDVALATSALWRRITVERLRINLFNRPILEAPIVSVTARQLAGRIVGNAVLRGEMPPLAAADRAVVLALLPGLTPGQDIARLAGPMLRGFSATSWTPRIISACVAMVQAISDPAGSRQALDRLFDDSNGRGRIWQVAAHSVLLRTTPPDWIDRLQDMRRRILAENGPEVRDYLAGTDSGLDTFSIATPLAFAKHGVSMAESFWKLAGDADASLRESLFTGLAAVGLYYPMPALSTAHRALKALGERAVGEQVAGVLSRIRLMHPALVDLLLRDLGLRLPAESVAESDLDFAWRHVDALGLYNNAVHQAIHYPRMRDGLLSPGFAGLAEAVSARDFVKGYVPRVLALLRETDYELTGWMR